MKIKDIFLRPVHTYYVKISIYYDDGTEDVAKDRVQSVHDLDWVRSSYTGLMAPGAERSITIDTRHGVKAVNLRLVRSVEVVVNEETSDDQSESRLKLVGSTEFDRMANRWPQE